MGPRKDSKKGKLNLQGISSRYFRYKKEKAGQKPGTVIYTGDAPQGAVEMSVFRYNRDEYQEVQLKSIEEAPGPVTGHITWFNLDGVYDTAMLTRLGEKYQLHQLLLEDIASTGQRSKIEEYGDTLFLVARMLDYDDVQQCVKSEQISFVLREGLLLSFQETPGDVFGPVRDRIRTGKGNVRYSSTGYLTYTLLDCIVDRYFLILDKIGERLETLEMSLFDGESRSTLGDIHGIKKEIMFLRKAVWPLREMLSTLHRLEHPLVDDKLKTYLRDVYDHTIQVIETIETFRDAASGLHDLYMSTMGHKMNEVMKVLTIFSTIFIPLTFIAGVYGMNFHKNFPEIEWEYGYATVWGVMIAIALGMLYYFRRKNWF